jgi:hypothetical protein
MVSLSVRTSFTGKAASFNVDPQTTTVSALKTLVTGSSLFKGKAPETFSLSWKGHALSGQRLLSYYGIGEDDSIQLRALLLHVFLCMTCPSNSFRSFQSYPRKFRM